MTARVEPTRPTPVSRTVGEIILVRPGSPGPQGAQGPPGGGGGGGGAVSSVAGRTGAIVLVAADISNGSTVGRSIFTAGDAATVRTLAGVTLANLGIPLVDNTSDAGKPVSTAQEARILARTPGPIIQNPNGSWPSRTTVTLDRTVEVRWVGTLPGPTLGTAADTAVRYIDNMKITRTIPS